jgi:uncharacterized delta-60 repeat protein
MFSAANVNSAGQASEAITLTFTDSAGISPSSVNTGNITVTNVSTSATLTVMGVTLDPSNGVAGQVTAVYDVAAPDAGSVFTSDDDGAYSVVLGTDQVSDSFNDQAPQTTGAFNVEIPPPGATAPTASITAPSDVTAAGTSSVNVTVVYAATAGDGDAIDASSINNGNINVNGPSGALIVTGVSVVPDTGDAATLTATYSVAAPTGAFTPPSDGPYTISLNSGQPVLDTFALAAVASPATASFNVSLGGPPTVMIGQPANVTSALPTETVSIVYNDAAGINLATITTSNIVVTEQGVSNPTPLNVSGVTLSVTSGSPTQVTATYTIVAPGGGFSQSSDGTYSVALQANQVEDINSLFAPATMATFSVNIASPATPPTAVIAAPDEVADTGVSSVQVTVTYTDAVAIDASTINAGNISVTGPAGNALTVTGVSIVPSGNAASVSATYTVAAPSDLFGTGNNGTYTITLIANQVLDTNGLPATAAPATFDVDIPTPPPTVDPTFNGGSPVVTTFVAEDVVSLPNGELLVAGHQGDPSADSEQAVIERLFPNGSIDPSFGTGGKVVTGTAGENDAAYSIGLNASGQIVIAGTHAGEFAVWRFNANGKADNTFGTMGLAATSLGSSDDIAYGFAIGSNGSIVLGGSSNGAFAFARFTANGTLDTTFGTGGRALFGVAGGTDVVGAVAIEPDGNIVAAGSDGTNVDVLSLTPAGSQDPGFAGGNTLVLNDLGVRTDLGTPDFTEGLAIQPNGQVLVANRTTDGHFGVVRINSDGSLDNGFGSAGLATADFGGDDEADAVEVQGTGQIFAIGTTDAGGSPQTAVAAFTTDGRPDPTFGVGGKFTVPADITTASIARPAPGTLRPQALHIGDIFLRAFGDIQANGQLVVGTTNETNPATQTPLLRLNVPGSGTVGTFGTVGRKNKSLVFLESNGTKVTVTLKGGGTGTAYYNGTEIDLVLTGTSARSSVTVTGTGGNRRVSLRNISSTSALHAFSAPTGDLSGTLYVPGSLAALTLGTITGTGTSTIAAAGSIGSISIAGVATGATVLAGANLGSDALLGGTGSAADAFGAGAIGKITINGAVTNSTFGAGLDPSDGVLRSVNDSVIGGAASRIGSVALKHPVDASTRFYAGAFGKIRAPKKVVPAAGTNFEVL